jgi:hypothetical protein
MKPTVAKLKTDQCKKAIDTYSLQTVLCAQLTCIPYHDIAAGMGLECSAVA